MKITKEKNQLVCRIPLKQNSYDAIDEFIGVVPNLIGVSDDKNQRYSISQLIDLGYKDDQQEGSPYISFDYNKEEFEKACKLLGLNIWYK